MSALARRSRSGPLLSGVVIGVLVATLPAARATAVSPPCDPSSTVRLSLRADRTITLLANTSGTRATVADGDLQTALHQAFAALPGGGCIELGPGRYLLAGQVVIPSGIRLAGASPTDDEERPTIIDVTGTANDVLYTVDSSSVELENLLILANHRADYVVSLRCARDAVVRNVKIVDSNGAAFGSSGCTNCLFDRCEAEGRNPRDGHGFGIGGTPDGVPDIGTTLLDCRASGFDDPRGSHGIQVRGRQYNGAPVACGAGIACRVVCRGGWPVCDGGAHDGARCDCDGTCADLGEPTRGLRVVGGAFHGNRTGIWLEDVTNVTLDGVQVFDNSQYGLYVPRVTLRDGAVDVTVHGGAFVENGGGGSRSPIADVVDPREGGIRLVGTDSTIDGVELRDNRFGNLVLEGDRFTLRGNRFGSCGARWGGGSGATACATPPCAQRHVVLELFRAPDYLPVSVLLDRNLVQPVAGPRGVFVGPQPTVPPHDLLARVTGTTEMPPPGAQCETTFADDGDPCTVERCTPGYCVHDPLTGVAGTRCLCARSLPPSCPPTSVGRILRRPRVACRRLAAVESTSGARQRATLRHALGGWLHAQHVLDRERVRRALGAECVRSLGASLGEAVDRIRTVVTPAEGRTP